MHNCLHFTEERTESQRSGIPKDTNHRQLARHQLWSPNSKLSTFCVIQVPPKQELMTLWKWNEEVKNEKGIWGQLSYLLWNLWHAFCSILWPFCDSFASDPSNEVFTEKLFPVISIKACREFWHHLWLTGSIQKWSRIFDSGSPNMYCTWLSEI